MKGALYIVATPIGNLGDLSPRAKSVLENVDLIVAEDTRHSKPMLNQFGIETKIH
ncbi:MAG: SAM-dependent methyltransferase, partial [Gammaproteobacteria bacterium]